MDVGAGAIKLRFFVRGALDLGLEEKGALDLGLAALGLAERRGVVDCSLRLNLKLEGGS